jgi:hypothetical protein
MGFLNIESASIANAQKKKSFVASPAAISSKGGYNRWGDESNLAGNAKAYD